MVFPARAPELFKLFKNAQTKKNGRLVPARLVVSLGLYANDVINEAPPGLQMARMRRDLGQIDPNSAAAMPNLPAYACSRAAATSVCV
jgi:hypothetical protein